MMIRSEIVGVGSVFYFCSVRELLIADNEAETAQTRHSAVELHLIKKGRLQCPIDERDDILRIVQSELRWHEYGVRTVADTRFVLRLSLVVNAEGAEHIATRSTSSMTWSRR